jgi:phage baseplate assembly protein W
VNPIAFGNGVLAPLRRDGKGDFANADDIALVRSNVRQVIGTLATSGSTQGELPWRPEFGSIIQLLRFRNLDETTVELARTYVIDALKTWLFRVRVKEATIEIDYEAKALIITVLYDVLAANERSVIVPNTTETVKVPVAA